MNIQPVILDKSYLQAISGEAFNDLSSRFQWLMPDVLFYELIKSDEPVRAQCFRKLPQTSNPIPLIKSVSELLSKERDTHKPAGLPSENIAISGYRFHPDLSKGLYEAPDSVTDEIQRIGSELDRDIDTFIDKSSTTAIMFPNIDKGSYGMRKQSREEAKHYIINNTEGMAKFLVQLELPNTNIMLDWNILNASWTLFRWFQVTLLFGLDIRHRYGGINVATLTNKQRTDIKHDVLDARYLILGVLQGAFATEEKKLIDFFNLLCPGGILITKQGQ